MQQILSVTFNFPPVWYLGAFFWHFLLAVHYFFVSPGGRTTLKLDTDRDKLSVSFRRGGTD